MGCQSSKAPSNLKAASNPSLPEAPSKTLLDAGDAKKASANTSAVDAVTSAAQHSSFHSEGIASARADSVHSHGSVRKHRTLCTDKKELDIMVTEFTCHDSTVGSVLGRNCKEMCWKVIYDRDADPIDIKVHVQEHKLHSNEVQIECNGEPIFHGASANAKAKMTEDFRYQWSFRGMIQGVNEVNFFEFNPNHSSSSGQEWFPATITAQRPDGCFEVTVQEIDANGRVKKEQYPAVHRDSLREAASQNPIVVPENHLTLEVPKQDPLKASLSLANGELVTHHFGKPSPALISSQRKPEIALKVSKDRTSLTSSVGHQVLSHFVSGEVQAKASEAERLRHSWTVQVGPFAEHRVEIVKKYTLGKIVSLLVDGNILVESSAADIACVGGLWQCKFRLVGERVLDFEVYKTNAEGGVLDETGHVKERRKYTHECHITIPSDRDFSSARLFIDTVPFTELPTEAPGYDEPGLTTTPLALLHSYGISTPYMVDRTAPSNVMLLANQVLAQADDGRKTATGWFAQCCSASSVVDGNDMEHV